MHEQWQEFLTNVGAEFNHGNVIHYGNPRRESSVVLTGNAFADLSHFGLISVHGEDAVSFLQAQFSNDLNTVDKHHSQLSGYCNPKGRLIATLRIFQHADSYYLCLPTELVETIIKRLRMFVLRAQVTLEDVSDNFVHLGVTGNDIDAELGRVISSLPETVNDVTSTDETVKIKVPGAQSSYEIFTTVELAKTLWNALNVKAAPVGAGAWMLGDIQAGIPVIVSQTSEAFVPQMVNWNLVDGVSFKKGCYPGQEIVARMEYLGKLKRRMYKAQVASDQPPVAGDEVFDANGNTQPVGKLVSSANHPDGVYSLLVVLQISAAESESSSLRLVDQSGPKIELENLPYPFPVEDK
ncbi:MAG: folate-binding protein YgfZ [Gammaproteobacteria bacterium]